MLLNKYLQKLLIAHDRFCPLVQPSKVQYFVFVNMYSLPMILFITIKVFISLLSLVSEF